MPKGLIDRPAPTKGLIYRKAKSKSPFQTSAKSPGAVAMKQHKSNFGKAFFLLFRKSTSCSRTFRATAATAWSG